MDQKYLWIGGAVVGGFVLLKIRASKKTAPAATQVPQQTGSTGGFIQPVAQMYSPSGAAVDSGANSDSGMAMVAALIAGLGNDSAPAAADPFANLDINRLMDGQIRNQLAATDNSLFSTLGITRGDTVNITHTPDGATISMANPDKVNLSLINSDLSSKAGEGNSFTYTNYAADSLEVAINNIYQRDLGRAADTSGLAYWKSQVTSGAVGVDQLKSYIDNAAKSNGETVR